MTRSAAEEATAAVETVRDHPHRRLALAGRLYDSSHGGPRIRPYRRAEMAFMRWQIRRGVLAPPTGDRPGSPWWRAVNETLLLVHDSAPVYAWRYEDRAVWATKRTPALRFVTAMTRAVGA